MTPTNQLTPDETGGPRQRTHTLIVRAVDVTGDDVAQVKVVLFSAPSIEQVQEYERLTASAFRGGFEEDPDRLMSAVLPYAEEEDGDES